MLPKNRALHYIGSREERKLMPLVADSELSGDRVGCVLVTSGTLHDASAI